MSDVAVPAIPIGPVPTSINVTAAKASDGSSLIGLKFDTPQGSQIFFFGLDIGRQLAELIRAQCDGRPSLVIPSGKMPE